MMSYSRPNSGNNSVETQNEVFFSPPPPPPPSQRWIAEWILGDAWIVATRWWSTSTEEMRQSARRCIGFNTHTHAYIRVYTQTQAFGRSVDTEQSGSGRRELWVAKQLQSSATDHRLALTIYQSSARNCVQHCNKDVSIVSREFVNNCRHDTR